MYYDHIAESTEKIKELNGMIWNAVLFHKFKKRIQDDVW